MVDPKFNIASNAYLGTTKMGGLPTPELDSDSPKNLGKPSFGELVGESLSNAKSTGYTSESVSVQSIAEQAELHELVTSVTNAELTLNTVVAVRDRVIQAYQDILKMPI